MGSNTMQPQGDLTETSYTIDIIQRALAYIRSGYPVHFRGPAGTGKTTLALHLARQIGRPVVLIHGKADFSPTDLTGGLHGYRVKKVIDNFIHSVLKTEEEMSLRWIDGPVTEACRCGYTLLYDEFTRSTPEANNILLAVLEEKVLALPVAKKRDEKYIKVHPDFAAIFTSNPSEYAGVYKSQDALRDRMITIDLQYYDEASEIAITAEKSGLPAEEAVRIVKIVRAFRERGEYEFTPTIRACIAIARIIKFHGVRSQKSDKFFEQVCLDILTSETGSISGGKAEKKTGTKIIRELIEQYC